MLSTSNKPQTTNTRCSLLVINHKQLIPIVFRRYKYDIFISTTERFINVEAYSDGGNEQINGRIIDCSVKSLSNQSPPDSLKNYLK
jgi:hypothetical protein